MAQEGNGGFAVIAFFVACAKAMDAVITKITAPNNLTAGVLSDTDSHGEEAAVSAMGKPVMELCLSGLIALFKKQRH